MQVSIQENKVIYFFPVLFDAELRRRELKGCEPQYSIAAAKNKTPNSLLKFIFIFNSVFYVHVDCEPPNMGPQD